MTFAVYHDDPGIDSWLRGRIEQVTGKHPSRVLDLDGSQPAQPQQDSGEHPPEWNDVPVGGMSPEQLVSTVKRLELLEAPLVLAWIARLQDDRRFAELAKIANTLIVSTSALGTGDEALRDICSFTQAHPEVVLHDIAYLRLGTWQEIIAEFFDEPNVLDELYNIRRVEVVSGSDAEALYLIAWLASRLQWKPCGHSEFCNIIDESIEFTIKREGQARRLTSVSLISPQSTFTAAVHDDDQDAIVCTVTGKHPRQSRTMPVTKVDVASLVERAVLHPHHDPIFTATLHTASRILEHRTKV